MNADIANKIAEDFLTTRQPDNCIHLLESLSKCNFKFSFDFKALESNEIFILNRDKDRISYTFGDGLSTHPYKNVLAKHWINSAHFFLKLFSIESNLNKDLIINIGDYGSVPGIAFSDYRDEYKLIPDPIFVMTNGYEEYKKHYRTPAPFYEKIDSVFWRGATTGFTDLFGLKSNTWKSIARVQLCNYCKTHAKESDVELDVFISNTVQIDSKSEQEEIAKAKIIKEPVHWSKFGDYKYQIDIDGNSNSWPGLFLKLLTASPVLKIESAIGFKQWYYNRLIPWHNFIPINKDLSNLIPTINWLQDHPIVAEQIGRNGHSLAMSMTNDSEVINTIFDIYNF